MRTYILAALALMVLVLQVSFVPALRPFGAVPDLALVLVATAALTGPIAQAMVIAIATGFVLDAVSGSDFGLRMGLLAVAVIMCAFVRRSGLRLGLRVQLAAIILVICSLGSIFAVSAIAIAGGRIELAPAFGRWFAGAGMTIALALLFGPVISILTRSADMYGDIQ